MHIAAKALILRAFSSLLAQRQIDSTHISRKPIARRPMYINSLMTESQRTPGRSVNRRRFKILFCLLMSVGTQVLFLIFSGAGDECQTDLVSLLVSAQWSCDTFLPDRYLEEQTHSIKKVLADILTWNTMFSITASSVLAGAADKLHAQDQWERNDWNNFMQGSPCTAASRSM